MLVRLKVNCYEQAKGEGCLLVYRSLNLPHILGYFKCFVKLQAETAAAPSPAAIPAGDESTSAAAEDGGEDDSD